MSIEKILLIASLSAVLMSIIPLLFKLFLAKTLHRKRDQIIEIKFGGSDETLKLDSSNEEQLKDLVDKFLADEKTKNSKIDKADQGEINSEKEADK